MTPELLDTRTSNVSSTITSVVAVTLCFDISLKMSYTIILVYTAQDLHLPRLTTKHEIYEINLNMTFTEGDVEKENK